MTNNDKQQIRAYLCGPRDYAEGLDLYRRHGSNRMLARRFALDPTETTRQMLLDELRRMAGISPAEYDRLPRLAKQPRHASPDADIPSAPATVPVPKTERRMERFRQRYPFLQSPDCPDVLKIMVADMFTAYADYKSAHAQLAVLDDVQTLQTAELCEKAVNAYLANREIWDELEYYKANGTILGKSAKFRDARQIEDLAALADVDLMRKLQSAQVNVSKQRKRLADASADGKDTAKIEAALNLWTDKKTMYEAEVARRKKK